jgi:hypothetical protein
MYYGVLRILLDRSQLHMIGSFRFFTSPLDGGASQGSRTLSVMWRAWLLNACSGPHSTYWTRTSRHSDLGSAMVTPKGN